MNYVISDIHGHYDKYLQMLKKINFQEEDNLYVLGDVLDRGPDGIKILQDMMMRLNVIPILGNHEYMALMVLERLCVEVREDNYDSQVNVHNNKTSDVEAVANIEVRLLTTQRYSYLSLAQMSTTGSAYTNFDAVKLFQYFGHFLVTKF